jgi:hypothetical protein
MTRPPHVTTPHPHRFLGRRAPDPTRARLHLGIQFPATALTQFDHHEPWDVTHVTHPRILGGHAIHAGYYSDPRNLMTVTTWGRTQPMTDRFFDRFVEEAWVAVTPEWFSTAGLSPTGLDLRGLGAELTRLTGDPDPFTTRVLVPAALPGPVAVPVQDPGALADQRLITQLGTWPENLHIGANARAATAIRDWKTTKNL